MKVSRIWGTFPWRIALILALVPCLPLLGFWAWFRWEVPPLQRYYLLDYWVSSKGANQPDSKTQIQWLMETAPGRKSRWLLASDVTEGSQNGLPLELTSVALGKGWVGIEKTSEESIDSAELEGVLREDFFDGQNFRQLVNEPLLYGVAGWVIVAYIAFMMRGDIGDEWRELRRVVTEPQWSSNSGFDWPGNRERIAARILSRIAHWNAGKNVQRIWANLRAAISSRSGLNKLSNSDSFCGSDRPESTEVQDKVLTAQQSANPLPSNSPEPPPQRRTIFPGSSSSGAAHSQSKPWGKSEWID